MRWLGFAWLVLGLASACGRHALTARRDGGADAQPDAAPDLRDAAADPRDAALDRAVADTAAPEGPPADGLAGMVACSALAPLAARGVLTTLRSRQVTFARDRSFIVLRVRGDEMDAGSERDWLVRVGLPSGKLETLSRVGGTAKALGPSGLLVVGADGDTGLAVYDGVGLRPVAAGVCGHGASPDGRWLYVIRDCGTDGRGTLDVIDMTNGTTSPLATNVLARGRLAVSPGGTYAAFVVSQSDAGWAAHVINVATIDGKTYALSSDPGASDPWFANDSLLLFSTGSPFGPSSASIRGHVPPDTSATYLVAEGRSPGLFGYKLSPDGEWLLAAGEQASDGGPWPTALLYSLRTDGRGEHLLTSDLLPYWAFDMAIDGFDWTGDGTRAVFATSRTRGVGANNRLGTSPSDLSNRGFFRTAPAGDRVALLEPGDAGAPSRVRLVAAGSGQDVASFASDKSVGGVNFLPGGRALLFVNYPAAGPTELRQMDDDGTTVLATWSTTLLAMDGGSPGSYFQPYGSYPVDPTGCFTVVDTDLAPSPGTRLVLLRQ